MLTDEVLDYIFDGQLHILAPSMTEWLTSSRRFTVFVNTFRDKIRKKLRVTHEEESLLDLRLELETAYLLLQEPRLSLIYEPHLSEKVRGPDFAVTFTTSLTFMVEVTRLRAVTQEQQPLIPTSNITDRLTDAVCSKLAQLQPQHSNVLLVGVDAPHLTQSDLRTAMLRLQQRAERDDAAFLQRYRFRDRATFFRHYQQLTEVFVRETRLQTGESMVVWVNPQAKHPLPSKVQTALYHSHAI
jgi:hypothetical protein